MLASSRIGKATKTGVSSRWLIVAELDNPRANKMVDGSGKAATAGAEAHQKDAHLDNS